MLPQMKISSYRRGGKPRRGRNFIPFIPHSGAIPYNHDGAIARGEYFAYTGNCATRVAMARRGAARDALRHSTIASPSKRLPRLLNKPRSGTSPTGFHFLRRLSLAPLLSPPPLPVFKLLFFITAGALRKCLKQGVIIMFN